ncbi:MAG: glycine cleavage system protein GcvH [Spirosomaceae bacterium]|nr:glycine cleavage system protein GcvH [Spirosomataceae bacterium]
MNFPENLRYTEEHEWVRIEDENTAVVGITDFAQSELGDIVYVEIESEGEEFAANEVFGSIEAVKTVSDLFLPMSGTVIEVNEELADAPETVNNDPYEKGWLIKMTIDDMSEFEKLMTVEEYKKLIGK